MVKSQKYSVFSYFFVSAFLAYEMAVQVSPSIMATQIKNDLNMNVFFLGVMSSVYFYTYSIMQLPSGLLFDRIKPNYLITGSIICCASGALLFAHSTHFWSACLARLVMGLGSAFAFISVLVVASDLFSPRYFPLLTGITQMLAALGAMGGQLPISLLIAKIGWRHTMLLLGIFGFVLAAITWFLTNYQKNLPANRKIKIWHTIKKDLKKIVSHQQNWWTALYAFLLWAPMSGFASLWGPQFLQHFDHLSHTKAAFALSMMWLGLAIGSPLLGSFAGVCKNKVTPLRLSSAVGIFSFALLLFFHWSFFGLLVLLMLSGAACSGQALSFAIVRHNNAPSIKSTAIAFNNMAVVVSGAVFQPLMAKIITLNEARDISWAYQSASLIILLAYGAGFLVSVGAIRCISSQGAIRSTAIEKKSVGLI